MRPQDVIRLKRDRAEIPEEAIEAFIAGVVAETIPDYQISALLMAIFWRGMTERELAAWTKAMVNSGQIVDLSHIPGVKVDKHSTGGVGDKVSLCLAPLVAECGVLVPMISGRGLGHTGGTLDKLEAIPGFTTNLPISRFVSLIEEIGIALIGQTNDLAPADRKLYALRDVTSTVESIPLIASSIMSKKLAEGIDALVLDVKVGSGAFMKTEERARELAKTICNIGHHAKKRVTALLTDMNQPLGCEIGNATETREAIDILRGEGPEDLWQLTRELGAEMLVLGQRAQTLDDARHRLDDVRRSGKGLERFARCIEKQHGDPRVTENVALLPQAPHHRAICAQSAGYLSEIETDEIGRAAMLLGAGRMKVDDTIDPAAGITISVRRGDSVSIGDRLATLHFRDERHAHEAEAVFRNALKWSDAPVETLPPLIYERITNA